jgi:hypothetical protein
MAVSTAISAVATVPEHRARARLRHDVVDDLGRLPAAQHERRSELPQRLAEPRQAHVQPPPGGAAERADPVALLVEHVQHHDRLAPLEGRVEGGVVGHAEVVAEPHDARPVRVGGSLPVVGSAVGGVVVAHGSSLGRRPASDRGGVATRTTPGGT